jgi:hypothetical protein
METYLSKTKRLPCAVKFAINTDGSQVPMYFIGYDPINPNTKYFRSRFLLSGEEEIVMNCPQSPILMKILVWSENDEPFECKTSIVPLDVPAPTDPVILFIERFARRVGRLRPGVYGGPGVPFKIQLLRNIYTDDGDIHPTPARIAIDQPVIQVSKTKFDDDTIPERIIILLHEFSHNFLNSDQDNELEADQNALDTYNQLGYPKMEDVNAFGDIMADTDSNAQRMLNLISM